MPGKGAWFQSAQVWQKTRYKSVCEHDQTMKAAHVDEVEVGETTSREEVVHESNNKDINRVVL